MALISSRSGAADTGTHRRHAGKKQQHYCKNRKQLRQRPNRKNNKKNKPIFSYMPANNEAVVWIQDVLQKPWSEPGWKFGFPQLLLLHSRLDESYVFKKKQSKKNTHIQADEDQVCVRSSESRQPIRSWVEMSSLKTTSWSLTKKTTKN